jgi:hypothetical protein
MKGTRISKLIMEYKSIGKRDMGLSKEKIGSSNAGATCITG